jgi:Holliday junction resolvasome RuvABC endonuclease subunit
MKIAGIDPSMDSTGKCIMTLDDNFEVVDISFYGYNKVRKRCFKQDNVEVFHVGTKYSELNMFDRQNIAYDFLNKDMEDVKFVSFEGYAFGSTMTRSLVQLGEFNGGMKKMFYDQGKGIMIYSPKTIKRFACGDGNADKIPMCTMFKLEKPNLYPEAFSLLDQWKYESPHGDICDAFWIAEALRCHIMYEKLGKHKIDEKLRTLLEHKSTNKSTSIVETKLLIKK